MGSRPAELVGRGGHLGGRPDRAR